MTAFQELAEQMEAYFIGLHKADSEILNTVFHPDAQYVNARKGEYTRHDMATYMAIIDERASPESMGTQKNGEIISIEFDSDQMAIVKARMSMLGRTYMDYLTFIRDEGQWQIICKVFTYQLDKKEG
jgi:hypothetical protein